jgi:hypothetical protein
VSYWQSRNPPPRPTAGLCLWCGRILRWEYDTKIEIVTNPGESPRKCHCGCKKFFFDEQRKRWFCEDCRLDFVGRRTRKVVSRTHRYDAPGGYGDGFFCGIHCGYQFAVDAAGRGTRLS